MRTYLFMTKKKFIKQQVVSKLLNLSKQIGSTQDVEMLSDNSSIDYAPQFVHSSFYTFVHSYPFLIGSYLVFSSLFCFCQIHPLIHFSFSLVKKWFNCLLMTSNILQHFFHALTLIHFWFGILPCSTYCTINPILRGIKSNLFYAESNPTYYAPLWFLKKKSFFAQFLLHTQTTTHNRVTHKKNRSLPQKTKKWVPFQNRQVKYAGRISSIFCIFYLCALKWL